MNDYQKNKICAGFASTESTEFARAVMAGCRRRILLE